MENNEITTVENTVENNVENTFATENNSNVRTSTLTTSDANKTKIKKFLPLVAVVIVGLFFLLSLGGKSIKYTVYDFNLEAYGETLNGDSSEMLKDCYFEVNYEKDKITMHNRGKTYKGKISLMDYDSSLNDYIYGIEWNTVPKVVEGYYAEDTAAFLRSSTDNEILVYIPVNGRIGTQTVELDAYYYCYED